MSVYTTEGEHHIWFDSLEEMEREAAPHPVNADMSARLYERMSYDWFYADSYQDAKRKIRDGWPELTRQLQPMIDSLRKGLSLGTAAALHVPLRRRRIKRMEAGDVLDMTRVWNGDLEHAWSKPVRCDRLTTTQRYATIFANIGCHAGVAATDTLWRAAAAHCMIDVLTQMAIATEVWVGSVNDRIYRYEGPDRLLTGVRVKPFTQPVNHDRLSTMLCAPFYRTWGFDIMLTSPWRCGYGLGYPSFGRLVKPLHDRSAAGERVFEVGKCLSYDSALQAVQQAIDTLKQDKEVA